MSRVTTTPPWAIIAPHHPIDQVGFDLGEISLSLLAQDFNIAFDCGDIGLSGKVGVERWTCSSAKTSACCSVKPLSVKCLTNRWVSKAIASDMGRDAKRAGQARRRPCCICGSKSSPPKTCDAHCVAGPRRGVLQEGGLPARMAAKMATLPGGAGGPV